MRRILQAELDAKYFRMGQAALKSFLKHNPGWELVICDLGLTGTQREELKEVATLEQGTVWEHTGRWTQSTARMECLAKLCQLPDTLILHLDADTLTFGSVEPLVEEMQRANIPVMASPMQSEMSTWTCALTKLNDIYKNPNKWLSHHCYNVGVMAVKASKQLADVFAGASKKYIKHRGIFRGVDQTAMVAELLDAGIMVINTPQIYNFSPASSGQSDVALFNPPIMRDGTELCILHIPVDKLLVFASDGPWYATGWWWRQWMDRYEEEPWPTTV